MLPLGTQISLVILTLGLIYSFARRPYYHLQAIWYFHFDKQAFIQADRRWLNLNTHPFQWQMQILENNVWYRNCAREGQQYFLIRMVTSNSVPFLHFVQSQDTLVFKEYQILCFKGIYYWLRCITFLSFYVNVNNFTS